LAGSQRNIFAAELNPMCGGGSARLTQAPLFEFTPAGSFGLGVQEQQGDLGVLIGTLADRASA
jgi:hypothetical protein